MNQPSPKTPTLEWQPEKRLQSQDRLWILTDTYTEWRSFREDATPQKFYRVGCYDLRTMKIGYVRFSVDDCTGLLKAQILPPPWPAGLAHGIEVKRMAHDGGEEKGRFKVDITLLDIDPAMAWIAPAARILFRRDGHWPNSTRDMWKKRVDRVALVKSIEAAALGMAGRFSAKDVHEKLGRKVPVSHVLRHLVNEKRLLPFGEKRGRTYEVAPPMVPERVDWAG